MKPDEFRDKIRALRIPAPSERAREDALEASLAELRMRRPDPDPEKPRAIWLRWPWLAMEASFVALAIAFGFAHWRSERADQDARDAHLFTEMATLFPGQLEAVVTRGDDVDLQLASAPGRISGEEVVVEFSRGREIVRVLACSGSRVCIDLTSRVCFDVLTTGEGGVLISGEDFVWSVDRQVDVQGYRVAVHVLKAAI